MKKTIIGLLLLVGMTSVAQKKGNDHRRTMKDLTPEQVAILRTKKMTLTLDLSLSQQKQIQSLTLENAKFHKTKMAERRNKRKSDVVKKLSSEDFFVLQNERLDYQIAQKTKIKGILTKEQFFKWEKANSYKRKQHLEKRKERGEEIQS